MAIRCPLQTPKKKKKSQIEINANTNEKQQQKASRSPQGLMHKHNDASMNSIKQNGPRGVESVSAGQLAS